MSLIESVNQESSTAVFTSVTKESKSTGQSASSLSTLAEEVPASDDERAVCWLGVKRSPYQLNHHVELLHLQAEAEALLMKLQNINQPKPGANAIG